MALRELVDRNGTTWLVFAVQPTLATRATGGTRAELAQGWLCFQCERERRRIPGIPRDWESMDDRALIALLADAPVAPRPRRSRRRSI
jgi:hypothetical protein